MLLREDISDARRDHAESVASHRRRVPLMRDLGGDAASAWELELDIGVSGPMDAQGGPKRHLPLAAEKIRIVDVFAKGAEFHLAMSQEGHAVLLHTEVLLAKRM